MQCHHGYLWFGTNLGLTRFDGYRFVNFYREENGKRVIEHVTSVVEDTTQNRLLVCGKDYLIYPFNLEQMTFEATDSTVGNRFAEILDAGINEPVTVRKAWERGVQWKNISHRHNAVKYVTLPNGHEVWGTIDNGFYFYDSGNDSLTHYTSHDAKPVIESDDINDMLLDRSGAVWMMTAYAGVYKLMPGSQNIRYHTLSGKAGAETAASVRTFLQLADGAIAVADMDGNLYRYDLKTDANELILHRDHRIYAVLTDQHGRLWTGTRGGGVWAGERHLNREDGLDASIIFDMIQAPNGTMWIASLDRGLWAAKERTDGSFALEHFMQDDKLHKLLYDGKQLWIATEKGLYVKHDDTIESVVPNLKIVDLCQTPDGTLVAASVGMGLLKVFRQAKANVYSYSSITADKGLANDNAKAVRAFPDGSIVVGTDAGLSIIHPEGTISNIYSTISMMADVYNESAALLTDGGHILLGSLEGFVEIESDEGGGVSYNKARPIITSIAVNDVFRYSQHFTSLTLPHDQNNLNITFSCLDYKNQPSIIYSYRLDGIDSDWRPSTKESNALYNNLSPGHYHFRLQAALAGQTWSEETVLDIYIQQPWWWTWCMRTLYLLALALLLWYEWHQYQHRLSLRRQLDQRLTALYAMKTKPATANVSQGSELTKKADETSVKEKIANQQDKEFLDKLDRLILDNLMHESLDMPFLTSQLFMSHSTLYRKLKSLTGMTATEYVRKHRLAKAMQLLREGHTPSEVSMECGFGSPSYFTRCFKVEYGMLPSEV